MQKTSMFQSFMKKKQMINKMISQSKSPRNVDHFQHFQAVSEPVYIKAESNAIYLTHLNTEFKDQLREFVHQQQSFKETMFQLAKITQSIESQHQSLEKQHRNLRNNFNEVDLEKQCLADKNNMLLNKIMTLQQQQKSLSLRSQEYEKIATSLQQDIEYEKCISSEIKTKNSQVIERLQIKSAQIQMATLKLEENEKQIRQKQSKIKDLNEDIKSIYFTLEAQDDALSTLCTAIEQGLNQQNNRINDIEFVKNDLSRLLNDREKKKKEIKEAEEIQQKLLNYSQDLDFDLRRTTKQLQIEQKGIDEEYWRIEQENQRLEENRQMLAQLQQFLLDLVNKNQMMQRCLQEQIIQDYAVKKVVESKCQQPVGKKTRMFLQQIEEKEFAETQTSWCKENVSSPKVHPQNQHSRSTSPVSGFFSTNSSANKKIPAKRQIGRLSISRVPQQMQFVFDKFTKYSQQNMDKEEEQFDQQQQNPYMRTGFSYIDRLAHLETRG